MSAPLTPEELAAIKARAEAATPGPWRWRGNTDCDDPRLVGGPRFADIFGIIRRERQPEDQETKDFERYLRDCYVFDPSINDGKGGDRPYTDEEIAEHVKDGWLEDQWGDAAFDNRLAFYGEPGPVYHYARDLAVYEVCPDATSRDDKRVYRADIIGLRHPNAIFIEHSRDDVDALLAEIERLRAELAEALDKIERRRAELVRYSNDALNIRGILSPAHRPFHGIPIPIGETIAPAIEWLMTDWERLAQRVAELEVS